jgi:hypothetical protein
MVFRRASLILSTLARAVEQSWPREVQQGQSNRAEMIRVKG